MPIVIKNVLRGGGSISSKWLRVRGFFLKRHKYTYTSHAPKKRSKKKKKKYKMGKKYNLLSILVLPKFSERFGNFFPNLKSEPEERV